MAAESIDKVLDLMFDSDRKLKKKYGISPEQRKLLLKHMLEKKKPKRFYNRLLTIEEKQAFTVEGFNYLFQNFVAKSISKEQYERLISLCVSVEGITNKKIDDYMLDKIIEMTVFTGSTHLTVRDLVEIVIKNPSDFFERSNKTVN